MKQEFIKAARESFPDITDTITRQQVLQVMAKYNLKDPHLEKIGRGLFAFPIDKSVPVVVESEEEINSRIRDTYESMESLVASVSANVVNSLIISGAPGIGKSHTVDKVLRQVNNGSDYNFVTHKGYLRASHLFRMLWENRHKGMTIVIDDCDSIFNDETALNILKSALEMKPVRRIGWGTEKSFLDEDNEQIPRYFDYEGSIIFLTNKDIRGEIAANNKNSQHLMALESRSLLLDMKIRSKREYLIKIKQTIKEGMLQYQGFNIYEEEEIMRFVEQNQDNLSELSLRMVEKIAALFRSNPSSWQKLVKAVCFK